MELIRQANADELQLIRLLIQKAGISLIHQWEDTLLVLPIDDGGMGSLHLYPNGIIINYKKTNVFVAEHQFEDIDEVPVLASLYIDSNTGEISELDIWKADFSHLRKIIIWCG